MKKINAASAAVLCVVSPALLAAEATLPEVTVTAPLEQSLTVPSTEQATADIRRTPGAVNVIPGTEIKKGPAHTIKDIVGWVPGVTTQTRWGPDARLSIRGSGLSRNYGNRGINMFMDGVPINTADGLFDLFEIDPLAYRYTEVFKGANAMRYGSNALGGAINFVTPTGRDAARFQGRFDVGSFGMRKAQASTGAAHGALDYFVTASAERADGYRDHSESRNRRLSGNVGFRISDDAETRFYLNVNAWRARLPGEVSKSAALNSPRRAHPDFVTQDQQRNIDSVRLANKTTLLFGPTTLEFGAFTSYRHVRHPIFQVLDFTSEDYGGFVRVADDRLMGGYRNHLVGGINLNNGKIDNEQYVNVGGSKGALAASNVDRSKNISAYLDNSFYVRPDVALVTGVQFQHAVRDRNNRLVPANSGRNTYNTWSPKVGVLWDVDPSWQVFANVSRSAEVPTYDTNSFGAGTPNLKEQTATTFEVGTRGQRGDTTWELAAYRARIKNELQCLTTAPWSPCSAINADRTMHQGIEAGFATPLAKSVFSAGDAFRLNAVYTYNDFRFDGDRNFGNNRMPGVPEHYLRAQVLYTHANGFYAGPEVEWMPKAYYADNANQLKVVGFSLLNFKVGYDAGNTAGWSAYLEGRNLLDKRYISSTVIAGTAAADAELFNPGTGRALYGGVNFKW